MAGLPVTHHAAQLTGMRTPGASSALTVRARMLTEPPPERRHTFQPLAISDSPVTTGDLTRFGDTFADLADPDVMSQAWQ
jgi:hypothetical protein